MADPTAAAIPRFLSAEQSEAFQRDGYLVLEGFADSEVMARLRDRAGELVDAFDPSEVVSIFSTSEQTRTSDDYFLESGDKIRFFFEEEAFDDAGNLRQAKEMSINKIGHALHELDPAFRSFSHSPELAAVAADIGMKDPVVLQSMYIFKQPRIGGEVNVHCDATFLYTEPITARGFWFALEGRNGRERLPVGRFRAATPYRSRIASAGLEEGGDRLRGVRQHAVSERRSGAAGSSGRHAGTPPRGSCRTTAHPTAPSARGTPTRCTPSSEAPTTRQTTGFGAHPSCPCRASRSPTRPFTLADLASAANGAGRATYPLLRGHALAPGGSVCLELEALSSPA